MDHKQFAEALLSEHHTVFAVLNEFEEHHEPVDLSSIPTELLRDYEGSKIVPPDPIRRYLESGDTLTNHTIDQMELAMEKTIGIGKPAYITSMREGSEKTGNLTVKYFYLDFE